MLYCLILLLLLCLSSTYLCLSLNHDATILRQAKLGLSDPAQSLSSWSENDVTPCHWRGITCDATSAVFSVNLSSFMLVGPFPSILCRLPSLSFLSLYNNSINGSLSGDDFASCRNLIHLNLSENLLVGSIPESLPFKLPNLRRFGISGNNLSDTIPASFGEFRKLEKLNLAGNLLSGTIPASLGNVSTLRELRLAYNIFSPGRIPSQLGNLTELRVLWLAGCNLAGSVPQTLSRLTHLVSLDLTMNQLTGSVPSWITELRSIEQIEIFNNSFSGELPEAMGNMTMLKSFDASTNKLTGKIPDGLARLNLESLNLFENMLEGPLPESITRSKTLTELKLFNNKLTGEIPSQLGANSPLQYVDFSYNQFSGEIPANICGGGKLEFFMLIGNSFSGEIPTNLGKCRSLTRVRLNNNKLSGHVPEEFWGLPRMSLLELSENSFTGRISESIAGAKNLSNLRISKNQFSGSIPGEIGSLNGLIEIAGDENSFSGEVTSTLVKLKQLSRLDLSSNQLSGEIPRGIRGWKNLNELNLANNHLSGEVPRELGDLSVLNYLDLSNNQFSGEIPPELQNLKLNIINLSYNHLTGRVPPLYANKIYASSFVGNHDLCVDDHDSRWRKIARSKNIGYVWILLSIFILACMVFVVGVVMFIANCKKMRASKSGRFSASKWRSFHKLHFSEHEIVDCLDERNVIGSGSSGKVYRVELSGGEVVVAVKKLNKTAKGGEDDSLNRDVFAAEVETLGTIRHKSIVRLWCCCSSGDCKLLVYEYMPNGSLADVLHSHCKGGVLLGWPERLRIGLDAAEGLSYLHHDCVPPIVHRDVKSSNILLDADYGAKVADFGIAKIGQMTGTKSPEAMSGIAGSCGYIAPEYVYTLRVNEKSDIYSFGIVLLELVTGKQPTDLELGDKDMVKWVCTTLDQSGLEAVIDPKLDLGFKEEISKVIHIGLLCTSPLPLNRPSMRKVVIMLQEVSGAVSISGPNASKRSKSSGKLSPYYVEDVNSV
ncbi:PREDICTED: receptor-like protein kinase 5 [Brassica oleracea var. oleracea]|uniref:non-specific serine/threonine protein kinase n=1 Tax=Brassica oleracea var. oleracea TaxID=109376 RepID=A0A0D3A3S0_BRAOL|nr:PREDICTED: receptor-like protein kinase 5 [Brassica oleracea var. oleracea]